MEDYIVRGLDKGDDEFIVGRLVEFNALSVPECKPFQYFDASRKILNENGDIIAGIIAKYHTWDNLYVSILWVDGNYRKAGLGTRLLLEAERIAKEQGCYLSHLDTFDFQAKDFYLKNGYEVFGVLEDCPAGHNRYFMKKLL